MDIQVKDILELKKQHPCGSRRFEVLRTGADIRIRCCSCSRELFMTREKTEGMVKKITRDDINIPTK